MKSGPERRVGRFDLLAELAETALGVVSVARVAIGSEQGRFVLLRRIDKSDVVDDALLRALRDGCQAAVVASKDTASGESASSSLVKPLEVRLGTSLLLASEFVEGELLSSWLGGTELSETPEPLALGMTLGLISALRQCKAAWQGDPALRGLPAISPAQVLISTAGDVLLLDAGCLAVDQTSRLFELVGYRCPVQLASKSVGDERAEVYSVGVVLWQLLTGKHPFAGADEAAVRQRMLAGAPALPGSVTPEVARLVARAMHRSPMQRFASLTAFADALGELGAGRCAAREEIGRALSERFGDRIAARRAAMEPRVSGNAEWVPTLRPDGVTEADEPRVPRHGRALEELVQVAAQTDASAGDPPWKQPHPESAASEPPASSDASGGESGAASSAPSTDRSPESRGPDSPAPSSRSPQSKRSDGDDHFATALSQPAQPIGRVNVEEAKETVIVDEANLAADQNIPTQMGERDSTPPSSTLGERGSRIDLDAVVAEFAGRDEATVVRPRGKRSKKKRKAAKSSSAGTWAFALLCVAGIGIGVFVGTRAAREAATPPPAQPMATTLSANDTEPREAAPEAANEAQAPVPPAGAAESPASADPSGSASPSSTGEPAASAARTAAVVAPAGVNSAARAAPSPTAGSPAEPVAAPRATGPTPTTSVLQQPKPAPKQAAPKPSDDNPY